MGNKSEDKREAKLRVYAEKGGPCPYSEGSRLAKFYNVYLGHYWRMESMLDEMAEVYGEFRHDRMAAPTEGEE